MRRQGHVNVTDGQGEMLDAAKFLRILSPPPQASTSTARAEPPAQIGASLRWAVAVEPDSMQPQLELQGMPTDARSLQKKYFSGDNAVSILLGAYPLNADTSTDPSMGGLIPQFFSPCSQKALEFFSRNVAAAKEIVSSINSNLLIMEHLTLDAAVAYLKAKKGRTAKGVPAFPIPQRKRGRPANQDISESGKNFQPVKSD